jgi:peptidoglycan/xylan/chitin deacetylase (PgdA/CDA1 family)
MVSPSSASLDVRQILVLVLLLCSGCLTDADRHTVDADGAVVRGETDDSALALVFTGDEYADGADHIRNVLGARDIKASFFLTGKFYRNPDFAEAIVSLHDDGHYLGAHSDQHLLCCTWEDRDSLLITHVEFERDVRDNYAEMARYGVEWEDAPYFLPSYEWYNRQIADWTTGLGLTLVNYTPGTRSHADYTTPDMGARYLSSDAILESILKYEAADANGLNGFILLMHIGTAPQRTDKLYDRLGGLLDSLVARGYTLERIDELLE